MGQIGRGEDMKFRIEIDVDGAAFEPSPGFEVRRIVEAFFRTVTVKRGMEPAPLFDSLNNRCGQACMVAEESEVENE